MTKLTPGVHDVMPCQSSAAFCSTHDAGHALLPIQSRAANATPSRWRDSIVTDVDADGWITLRALDGDETVRVWNHSDLSEIVSIGEPVALHELYHALAIGALQLNVVVAAA